MHSELKISVGQHSDKGRKEINQDFHGARIPKEPQLSSKGIAIAVADGIGSSQVSQVASQFAVTGILEDYYCTSEAWSVKTSVERVLTATNSWLHSQTQRSQHRHDMDRGYVCTLSALVFKSTTAHLFHVGDTRVYQVRGKSLEQLTRDHRLRISEEQSYLSRALGIDPQLEIDYQSLQVEEGDVFLLATDGVYEYADADFIVAAIDAQRDNLDRAAESIAVEACRRGSDDNVTVQLVRIESLPSPQANEMLRQLSELPFPPILEARMTFDGYRIVREVRGSSRSHTYLAEDIESGTLAILKIPSIDLRDDPAYLERFLMEEWIARRIDSPHVMKPCLQTRKRNFLYVVTEFVDGQTLTQWMADHPKPDVESVRGIVEQAALGLRAFHRLEMLHRDLTPDNVMIDKTGTVKIIDFGSTRVAGILEMAAESAQQRMLGAAQWAAPECFLGEPESVYTDVFSLGVIAYQMLTGHLPYGTQVPRATSKAQQLRLRYKSALEYRREIPPWVDGAIRKAVHPDPRKRYEEAAEFAWDLRHPNRAFLNRTRPPLIERDPVMFWKCVSAILTVTVLILLFIQSR
jgi:serine/threonine protein phosphatase PrpC/serine/threonine protein kinase